MKTFDYLQHAELNASRTKGLEKAAWMCVAGVLREGVKNGRSKDEMSKRLIRAAGSNRSPAFLLLKEAGECIGEGCRLRFVPPPRFAVPSPCPTERRWAGIAA